MSINVVVISGNLTRDPVLKEGSTYILEGGIACNEYRKGETVTGFYDWCMFGDRAQKIAQFLKKGMKVVIVGRLRYSSWKAQDGTNRSKVSIVVDNIELPPKSEPAVEQFDDTLPF